MALQTFRMLANQTRPSRSKGIKFCRNHVLRNPEKEFRWRARGVVRIGRQPCDLSSSHSATQLSQAPATRANMQNKRSVELKGWCEVNARRPTRAQRTMSAAISDSWSALFPGNRAASFGACCASDCPLERWVPFPPRKSVAIPGDRFGGWTPGSCAEGRALASFKSLPSPRPSADFATRPRRIPARLEKESDSLRETLFP
jgi:hypothetical protein